MSEVNQNEEVNMNEEVSVVVEDATVITTPIDDTLTISGDAADAKAVGDALALKANLADVKNIKVNAQSADNQGQIYIDGEDIQMGTGDTRTLRTAIEAAEGRTGATIPLDGTQGATNIAAKITEIDAKTAADISYGDGETVAEAISALEERDASGIQSNSGTIQDALDGIDGRVQTIEGAYLKKTTQELTAAEKSAVRTNIGLGDAATKITANNLTTTEEGYVLDARQGKALSDTQTTQAGQITALQNRNNRVNLSDQITFDNLGGNNTATYQTNTLLCYRYGNVCHLEFGLKFGSSQSDNSVAFSADFHGLPKMAGTSLRGVCGTATYSMFSYNMDSSYKITVRFVYNGSNAGTTNTYTQVIEYIIDDNAGGEESTPEEN